MKDKLLKFVKENGFLLFLFICVGVVAFSTIRIVTKDLDSKGGDLLTEEQIKDLPNKLNENDSSKNTPEPEVQNEELAKVEESEKELPKAETPKEKPKVETPKEKPKEKPKVEQNNLNKEKEESKPIQEVKKQEPQKVAKEQNVAKKEDTKETFSQGSDTKEKEQTTSKGKFIMPIEGKIITEFTKDNLIYSKTLDEWRAHPGIDISAKIGEKVKAPLDGVVKEIKEDPLWGRVVILDHGNGLLTKFANLGDTNMIKKDLKVKSGDLIGVVGKTADIEMLMDPHLHFEVIKGGKLVDPRSIP